jgi:hypothetical protein
VQAACSAPSPPFAGPRFWEAGSVSGVSETGQLVGDGLPIQEHSKTHPSAWPLRVTAPNNHTKTPSGRLLGCMPQTADRRPLELQLPLEQTLPTLAVELQDLVLWPVPGPSPQSLVPTSQPGVALVLRAAFSVRLVGQANGVGSTVVVWHCSRGDRRRL